MSRSPRPGRLAAAVLVASAACLAAPAARADVEIELGNGDRVTGTFLPADEVETFVVRPPTGASLTITASGKRRRGSTTPTVNVTVLDPELNEVAVAQSRPIRGGERVSRYTIPAAGEYRIQVRANAAGDYTFSATWKSKAVTRVTLEMGGAGDEQTVPFPADAGCTATVAAVRAAGSRALPRVLGVALEDETWEGDPVDPPVNENAVSHTARRLPLGGTGGDYVALVGDDSDEGGNVKVTVTVARPRGRPRSVDVTTRQTGADPANQYGKGAIFGPDGGELLLGDEGESVLDGTAISIPAGVLGKPVVILVTTDDPVVPPGGSGRPKGPAVNFAPDGLQFLVSGEGEQVLLTIPFDPTDFGGDFSGLDVWVRDASGVATLVQPRSSYVIDPVAGTLRFPVSHFSTYQVFGPPAPVPSDLNRDGFGDLVVPASAANGGAGRVHVLFGRADFSRSPPTAFDRTIAAPAGAADFGRATAVGDLNGDGTADLAVAYHDAASNDGAVAVWFGGTAFNPTGGAPSAVITEGGAVGTSFGDAVAIGDADGDGVADLVVGAPEAGTNGDEGAVFVFAGGASFSDAAADDADVIRLDGDAGTYLGVSFAFGRLLGGDEVTDLVIGAGGGPSGATAGSVHVVPGGDLLVSGPVDGPGVEYSGDFDEDRFGASVAVADVDDDGAEDLVVGAPGVTVVDGETSYDYSGVVLVFLGPDIVGGAAAAADLEVSDLPQAYEARGASVATGNFVGDSVRDLAFGAPLRDADGGSPADLGSVALLRGVADGPAEPDFVAGGVSGGRFGEQILGVVDLNGDGRHDLAVAAPLASGGAGRVTIFVGNGLGGVTVALTGAAGEELGR